MDAPSVASVAQSLLLHPYLAWMEQREIDVVIFSWFLFLSDVESLSTREFINKLSVYCIVFYILPV